MTSQSEFELTRAEIPEFYGAVVWACDEPMVGGVDIHTSNPTMMSTDDLHEFPRSMPLWFNNLPQSSRENSPWSILEGDNLISAKSC